MKKPLLGISLMPTAAFLEASLPLFKSGQIEVIEWSFDIEAHPATIPTWVDAVLQEYGNNNRLLGHGIYYSILEAKWTSVQEKWLQQLEASTQKYNYTHISEHFGFMSSRNFHKGFPLPVPLNEATLAVGIDRIQRLQSRVPCPVGLENLAFAFREKDIHEQGEFIAKLIAPVNGFIILDLHNIYCQAQNFGVDIMLLIKGYPLDAVKEIHISGGSWSNGATKEIQIRRDTHDGRVPQLLFDILPEVLVLCKHVEYVIFERLGNTFTHPNDGIEYRDDFLKLAQIITESTQTVLPKQWGKKVTVSETPIDDLIVHKAQEKLCATLLAAKDYKDVLHEFQQWDTTTWSPDMIHIAIALSKKWNL